MSGFRVDTLIAASPDECFSLSISVDAHTASMVGSGEQAIAGRTSGRMELGDTVTWARAPLRAPVPDDLCHHGVRIPCAVRGRTGSRTVRLLGHEHLFTNDADGRTPMVDTVRFASPLGPVGRIADRMVLNVHMPKLIRERNDWLKATLEAQR